MTAAACVCRNYGPGELMRCPASHPSLPARHCDTPIGQMGRRGRARVCLQGADAPDARPAPASVHLTRCPDRRCGAWLRVETWEDDAG